MARSPGEDSEDRGPAAPPSPAPVPADAPNEGARGVARRIDDLGRVVIPKEYRNAYGIRTGDLLDMTLEGDGILLRRLDRSCVFCGSKDDLGMFRGKLVCHDCVASLRAGG